MRFLGLVLCLLLPVEALALSCLRPSVTRTFAEVNAAAEIYIVVSGRLTLNERKLPKRTASTPRPPEMTRIKARLKGTSMTLDGFTVPFDQRITLEVACFASWCGGVQSGTDVLAFVRRDAGKYALGVNPCGGHVFGTPKPAMLKQVIQCYRGGACKDARD